MKEILESQLQREGNSLICPGAIIIKQGKILLGLRNYTPEKWKAITVWTTPGGRSEVGETIEQTLRREVQEEVSITNLQIQDFIAEVYGAKEGDIVPLFLCETNQEPTLMEPEKFSEWRWVPLTEYVTGGEWSTMNPTAHAVISEYFRSRKMV